MNYLSKRDIEVLSDEDLDAYADTLAKLQTKILEIMDDWVLHYNIITDEYERRKGANNKKSFIFSESTTIH